jgi:hypothetical protein
MASPVASPCIVFDGHLTEKGYGRINHRVDGRIVSKYAHRLAWEAVHGPIPDGMIVMHTCDNRPCINVEHLRLGTQSENMQDMYHKGRHWAERARVNGLALSNRAS